jgi:hypothetical protein
MLQMRRSRSMMRVARHTTTLASSATTRTQPKTEFSRLPRLWKLYTDSLQHQPLLTKAGMAAIIFFSSDSASQYVQRQPAQTTDFELDVVRALSGASFGVMSAAWLHYWWGFLEVIVGRHIPMAQYRLANTAAKVVVDQAIGAPIYIYSYYFITNFAAAASAALMTNNAQHGLNDLQSVGRKLHSKASDMLLPTMLHHWKVWPAVHSLNFYFTPLPHRVLVQNTVLVGWSGYLSHLNQSSNSSATYHT